MKLEPDKKLDKNLKLMRLCSQVKVIELTESMSKIMKDATKVITESEPLQKILKSELNAERAEAGEPEFLNPSSKDLFGTQIRDYKPSYETSVVYREYMQALKQYRIRQKALEEYQELIGILSQPKVSLPDFNAHISNKKNTKAFQSFVSSMKKHNPLVIATLYKHHAKELIERNNLQNVVYPVKLDEAFSFSARDVELSLGKQLKERVFSGVTKAVASVALASTLFSVGFNFGKNTVDIPTNTNPHAGTSVVEPSTTPTESPTQEELGEQIFSNSIKIDSYDSACRDFFQKTAEVYKFNTGEDINLSGLGQENIGINRNATLFRVSYNGETFTFSSQSGSPSNKTYLEKAFQALGVDYSTYMSRTTYIHDNDKSLAIVDASGTPVRSGNVLVDSPSGTGDMYNQNMVRIGREILEEQGHDPSSLSEAQCVAAYILSDKYTVQNPDLSIALSSTAELADTIKTTFYLSGSKGNEKEDSYAVYLYSQDSKDFAERFTSSMLGENFVSTEGQNQENPTEHDERE